MAGYVAMSRDWQDHDIFEGDEFSRRDAWAWLIANAAWKPGKARIKGMAVILARGELCFSQRFLAKRWRWSKSRVDRFIQLLRAEGMIETRSKIGATPDHPAGQGQSIISICNYDKYQPAKDGERGNGDAEDGATAGQQRGKEEESKKERKEERVTAADAARRYAFEGRVIRLLPDQFDKWQSAYPAIDLLAVLQARDDWLDREADEKLRTRWFIPTSNYLASLQQKATTAKREAAHDRDRITV